MEAVTERPMSESERIIWTVETKDQIREEHPDWTDAMVEAWFQKVVDKLKAMGKL